MRTDESIKKDIVDQLYYDERVDAADILVHVEQGTAQLTGTVPSCDARDAALSAAWLVDGIEAVSGQLVVAIPDGAAVLDDAEIEENTRQRLGSDSDIFSLDLDVSVSDGIVRLAGTVDSFWKKRRAESLAYGVRGTIEIDSHIAVAPRESYADKAIANHIAAALERDRHINARTITVAVEDGRVVLGGLARTPAERSKAYDAAIVAPGVMTVENGISVAASALKDVT